VGGGAAQGVGTWSANVSTRAHMGQCLELVVEGPNPRIHESEHHFKAAVYCGVWVCVLLDRDI